jgi:hypothetical protein
MKTILSLILALFLGGCVTHSSIRNYTISGGKVVQLPVAPGGALPSENADVKIEVTGFMLDAAKSELIYGFGFNEKKNQIPKKVVVDDVTGPYPVTLVTDDTPELGANGYWKGSSSPKKAGDQNLDWVLVGGNTEKVFQFTITTADNRVMTIYQASIWPAQAKPIIRKTLNF